MKWFNLNIMLIVHFVWYIKPSDSIFLSKHFTNEEVFLESAIRSKSYEFLSVNYDKFKLENSYDFIIVGSGPAGCVLANRLTEDPNINVLLLEAGRPELSLISEIPLASAFLQSTGYNWGYLTEPQDRACLSIKDKRCRFPHGRGLGGSSLINYMIYTRGNRRDFNRWEAFGNKGWSYDDVLPYFIKAENSHLLNFTNNGFHGMGGPLYTENVPFRSQLAHAYVQSAQEFGLQFVDYNADEQIGVSYLQSTTKNGWRFSSAKSYIHPIQDRKNLHISTDSWVTKLLLSEEYPEVVDGVRFVKNKREFVVFAKKEVILSAGSFESPKLLMLSGIGPKDDLEKLGIQIKNDLPVGKIMFEHISVWGPLYTLDNLQDGLVNIDEAITKNNVLDFLYGQGPFTSNGIESLAYIKTNSSTDCDPGFPDIELMQAIATTAFDTAEGIRLGLGLTDEAYKRIYGPISNRRSFMFLPMLLHPKSKGFMKLKSTSPFDHPLFYPNFYQDDRDMKTHLASIRMAQQIAAQKPFQKLGVKLYNADVPGCENIEFDSDEYWECYIMHLSSPLHHQVGTCKMGPETDPTSVVNDKLLVHGFENLRVIDTGIIPFPPSGHTAAFSFMIGEKGADIIKEKWASNNANRFRRSYAKFDWQKEDDENGNFDTSKHKTESRFVSYYFDGNDGKSKEEVRNDLNMSRHTFNVLNETKIDIITKQHTEKNKNTTNMLKEKMIELLNDDLPTANEDVIRTYVIQNGTYGKGKEKAKYITEKLAHLNSTEFDSSFIEVESVTGNVSTSTTEARISET